MAGFRALHRHRKSAYTCANTDSHTDAHIYHHTRTISHPHRDTHSDHHINANCHPYARAFGYAFQNIHPRANLDGFTDQAHQYTRADTDGDQIVKEPGSV